MLLAAGKFWEVIVLLERERPNAPSPLLRHQMRILLARATVRNPNWVKRGEEILRGVLGEDPENVEANLALARLYVAQGLPVRGRRFLARVLELKPDHREAASELKALGEG